MKAVRIHRYGNADVLTYEDAPLPEIASADVLVRVVAASVNPVDWKIREGYLKQMITYPFPLTLGWDVSGVVEAVGSDVTGFKVGDSVFSRPDIKRNGTYAEYVAIRGDEVAHKPKTVSHVEAAWQNAGGCGMADLHGSDRRDFRAGHCLWYLSHTEVSPIVDGFRPGNPSPGKFRLDCLRQIEPLP